MLWGGVTLSEPRSYTLPVRIEWSGYDTVHNVLVSSDTVMNIEVTTNGYAAYHNLATVATRPAKLDINNHNGYSTHDYLPLIAAQLGLRQIEEGEPQKDSLRFRLAARHCKAMVPQLKGVDVTFAKPYALSGKPYIKPDTVYLYGSEESLRHIEHLNTVATAITNISGTRTYTVALEPEWERYGDVSISTRNIQLHIPADKYTEKHFTLPIEVHGADSGNKLRIYPDHAEVTVYVSDSNYARLSADMLEASVNFDPTESTWRVSITDYPSYVRIRNIEPKAVQYVLIRK